jgi:hypothetical protein
MKVDDRVESIQLSEMKNIISRSWKVFGMEIVRKKFTKSSSQKILKNKNPFDQISFEIFYPRG